VVRMKCEAKLIALTQPVVGTPASGAESLVAYCARVSSDRPEESRGEGYEGLLKYCIRNKHWSVFEMADAVVEVKAPRDITRQLLRHRSFSFQEFSQRYSDDIEFTTRDWRHQDSKNRQNSLDSVTTEDLHRFDDVSEGIRHNTETSYLFLRDKGVAKECARVILPEGLTMSTLFVKGSLRSWIHYLEVRLDPTTQKEHRIMASKIKDVLMPAFPTVFGMIDD